MRQVPLATAIAAVLCLTLGSCGTTGAARSRTSTRFEGGISELEVQALVMQMADDYDAALGETTYLVLRRGHVDPTGRWLALSFLRNGMGAALDIAAGPNPDVALLDLLVLGSLQTWAFERHWIPAGIDPEAGAAAVAKLRSANDAMWSTARRLLSEDQERTLRGLIQTWMEQHPDQTVVAFVRFDDFIDERKTSTAVVRGQASGLLRDVGEATAAVEDARLFGERVLWFASRYPYLLGQQAELTAYRLADQPEVKDTMRVLGELGDASQGLASSVRNLERLTSSGLERLGEERARTIAQLGQTLEERLSQVVKELADRIETARDNTLNKFFERLDAESDRLAAEFDAVHGELEGTLGEAKATAAAAADAGRALTSAAEAADRLAERFDRDPAAGRPSLRLEDLRETAVAAQGAAERIDATLARLEGITKSGDVASAAAALGAAGTGFANALFWRGAGLIAVLVAGLALVRRVPARAR